MSWSAIAFTLITTMNPLTNLEPIQNWSTFSPDLTGYLSPVRMKLDTKESFQTWTKSLHTYTSPVANLVSRSMPFHFAMKLDGHDIPFPSNEVSCYTRDRDVLEIPIKRIAIQNQEWQEFLAGTAKEVLAAMGIDREFAPRPRSFTIQEKLLQKDISTRKSSTISHFVTLIVILPTYSPDLIIEVKNGTSSNSTFKVTNNVTSSIHFLAFYNGLDKVQISSTGDICYLTYHLLAHGEAPFPSLSSVPRVFAVVPQLRDTFRDWRAKRQLQASVGDDVDVGIERNPNFILFFLRGYYQCLRDLSQKDITLLAHLAPLAKAYGFALRFVQFERQETSIHKQEHPYKECPENLDLDGLAEELSMHAGEDKHTKTDIKFYNLSFTPIPRGHGPLKVVRKVIQSEVYMRKFNNLDPEKEASDTGETHIYYTTISLKHTRKATFLMILPQEMDREDML